MEKENIAFLEQLIRSLEDASVKLEEANQKRDFKEFRKIKSFMIGVQKRIDNLLK